MGVVVHADVRTSVGVEPHLTRAEHVVRDPTGTPDRVDNSSRDRVGTGAREELSGDDVAVHGRLTRTAEVVALDVLHLHLAVERHAGAEPVLRVVGLRLTGDHLGVLVPRVVVDGVHHALPGGRCAGRRSGQGGSRRNDSDSDEGSDHDGRQPSLTCEVH